MKFWKECGCGGDPTCYSCKGTGRVRDRDAEMEYGDRRHDEMKDERMERERHPYLYED